MEAGHLDQDGFRGSSPRTVLGCRCGAHVEEVRIQIEAMTTAPSGAGSLSDGHGRVATLPLARRALAPAHLTAFVAMSAKRNAGETTGEGLRIVYNIIHEQELLDAGDQLVAYLAQQAPAAPARRRPHAVGPPRPFASCDAAPRKDARASRHRITATGLGAAVAGHRPPRVPPKIPRRGSRGRTEPPSPTPRPQPGTRRAIPPPQPHQRPCPTQSPTSPRVAPVAGTRTGVLRTFPASCGSARGSRSRRRSEIKQLVPQVRVARLRD